MMAENYVSIKPFDGSTDFAMWQLKMKAVLIKENCWNSVEGEYTAGVTAAEKLENDEQAHSEIMIRLSDEVARQVMDKKTTKEMWEALKALYLVTSEKEPKDAEKGMELQKVEVAGSQPSSVKLELKDEEDCPSLQKLESEKGSQSQQEKAEIDVRISAELEGQEGTKLDWEKHQLGGRVDISRPKIKAKRAEAKTYLTSVRVRL